MLSILIDLAICARMKLDAPKNASKTAFDLSYVVDETETSITGKEGFYVAFRDKDDEKGELKFLQYNSEILTSRYRVYMGTHDDRDADCLRLFIGIQSYDQEKPLKFDLGVFADANFKTDQDTLSIVLNRRAFEIKSAKDNDESLVMLIVNGSYYHSVDTLYLGKLPNSENMDRNFYPYWDSSLESTTKTDDSVFAFSWQNRRISGGGYDEFGFIVVPKSTYSTEPFLFDKTPDLNQETGKQQLLFEILDYDPDDNLTMHCEINGKHYTIPSITAKAGVDKILRTAYFNINLVRGKSYHYEAKVIDKSGRESNIIKNTIYAFGGKPPELSITSEFQDDYNPKDLIYIEGKTDDDIYVYVYCQFDDYDPILLFSDYAYYSGYETFHKSVEIPTSLKLGEKHNLTIWAQDGYGLKSESINHSFYYINPDRPYITSLYLSDERLVFNQDHEIVIYGEGTDPDRGQTVTLYAKLDNGNPEPVGSFVSTSTVEPFAFFFPIKSGLSTKRHTIAFYLEDDKSKRSRNETTLSFLIYDPDAPLPPSEIGRIEDITRETIKDPSNALFNLKYYDVDGIGSNMTFNNEGFFAAFRVWTKAEGGKPLKPNIMQYSGGYQTTVEADNFMVSYRTFTDYETGYKRLQFTVTNNNYWPRAFELGVFADSDFAGDDNSVIKIRDDERGFIVTNEAKKIHYTIFTKDVYRSPSVTRHFLAQVEREGTEEIPANQIPFFASTDTRKIRELRGVNTGYAFSWKHIVSPNAPTTFAVLVAAHDKVKMPPRVIDNTKVDSMEIGDIVNLSFTIADADPGEMIRYNLTINSTTTISNTYKNNGTPETFTESIPVTPGFKVLNYHFVAEDMEEGAKLVSNEINKKISLTDKPILRINEINRSYHQLSKIKISGSFEDKEGMVSIYYQFVDGVHEGKTKLLLDVNKWSHPTYTFEKYLPIPDDLYSRDEPWGIILFAEDKYYIESEKVRKEFILRPYDPPKLDKAGLSKKIATVGDRILGYVSISDNQKDYIEVFVKVGLDSKYEEQRVLYYLNTENAGQRKPVAFFWTVPDVEPGTYDVAFYARDSEGSQSQKTITATVVINGK